MAEMEKKIVKQRIRSIFFFFWSIGEVERVRKKPRVTEKTFPWVLRDELESSANSFPSGPLCTGDPCMRRV